MGTRFVTSLDGTRIAYDISGQGPALMLLHGAGKTRLDWHKLGYVARLQKEFTVIAVDIRGTGDSDYLLDIRDFAIEKICQDLYAVSDDCSVDHFAIWGFSFGGNIARYLAAWSDRISALAVIGVPFGPEVDDDFEKIIIALEEKYALLVEEQTSELDPKKNRSPIKGQMAGMLVCFRAMRNWPIIDPEEIRCPSMIIVGSNNKNVIRWTRENEGKLDQADVELQIIDGQNHSQEFTKINQVFPVIHQFFKRHLNKN